jgi:predicted metal-dependent HD superfamily phosphohydrolase
MFIKFLQIWCMTMREEFYTSLSRYTSKTETQCALWNELEKNYSNASRHYHNLNHLNALLEELRSVKNVFINWDTIVFALAYHDAIYNTLKSNNEDKSATLALKRLAEINFPIDQAYICGQLIIATKKHEPSDNQTNYFTDADLSILGSDPNIYHLYTQQIRREYAIYPDLVYNPGRKKVLMHFLSMSSIYKTEEFRNKYEKQAKQNLQTELDKLS